MLEVAELTGVTELARQHPQGFDRPVGERGQLLSGGQRQAVLLARALLLDPPILLLDEPTSAMDNTSEDILRNRLHGWAQGKTVLLITHRASMLSLVERLVVLDGGHIVADGPKDAVIEALRRAASARRPSRSRSWKTPVRSATTSAAWAASPTPNSCPRWTARRWRTPHRHARHRVGRLHAADRRPGLGQVRRAGGSHHRRGQGHPSSKIQVIQNLEGGIVSEIFVREGQVVSKGDVLLRLDDTRFLSNKGETEADRLALMARVQRLSAEAEDRPFKVPEDIAKASPQLAEDEMALYSKRLQRLDSEQHILQEQLRQKQQELAEFRSKSQQYASSLGLLQQELNMSQPLVGTGAISEVEILRLRRSAVEMRGELNGTNLAIPAPRRR